ncbi:hypothetical protein [Lysinibacillus xylanilyticus]|uniref:hypothetical protein n=1 Tax=Lysinibacillus xylanilyticus TaxID=582475 RepID=UPI003D020AD1
MRRFFPSVYALHPSLRLFFPSLGQLSFVAALLSVGFFSPSVALPVLSVVAALLSVAAGFSFRRLAAFRHSCFSFCRFCSSFRRFPISIRRFACSFRRCWFFFPSLGGFPSLRLFFPSFLLSFPSLVALSVTSALLLSATINSNKPSYKI